MKVLYLTPGCYDKGGISRYSRYQINALRKIGAIKNIITLSLLGHDLHSFEEEFNITWSANGNSLINKIIFSLRTIIIAIRFRPDVIHIAHVNLSFLGFLCSKLVNSKLVLNVYGLEIWSGLKASSTFALLRCDKIISDCHSTKDYILNNWKINEATIEVIWDCVDIKKFKVKSLDDNVLKKYSIPSKNIHFNILTLGRLSKTSRHKGYDRLINVFKKINLKYPFTRLIIAGKGNDSPRLEKIVNKLDIKESVIFTGEIHEDDLCMVYNSSNIFSLVSQKGEMMGEGIPLTPIEAMACGLPIIVGNHDGSREAIFDDMNGFVINPFDTDKHEDCIISLIENQSIYRNMSKHSIDIATRYFSFSDFLLKHSNFYKHVLD
jgi:phosphatidyl-myo-inositol dimannoside synthase